MADNKGLFSGFNAAYSAVRGALGVHGNKCRREAADKSAFREPRGFHVDYFDDIPDPIVESWEPYDIPGPADALILSDVHFPFHAPEPLRAACREGKRRGADTIVLNGDICDCTEQSLFEKDPGVRIFPEEIRIMRLFLETLRKEFKKARIIYKLGNHEERYIRYMQRQAPILLNIKEFQFEEIMHLKQHGVEMVTDKRRITFGPLALMHGHEFGVGSSRTPAEKFYQNAKSHCLGGHFHRSGQVSHRALTGHVISTWSTGCLCQLHPQYCRVNDWNHGFAFAEKDKHDAFQVHNFRIFDGKVYQ